MMSGWEMPSSACAAGRLYGKVTQRKDAVAALRGLFPLARQPSRRVVICSE
jgi:hypothetical protein